MEEYEHTTYNTTYKSYLGQDGLRAFFFLIYWTLLASGTLIIGIDGLGLIVISGVVGLDSAGLVLAGNTVHDADLDPLMAPSFFG